MDSLTQRWTTLDFALVALQGVKVEDVKHAYTAIQLMPKIPLRREQSFLLSATEFEDVSVQAATTVIDAACPKSSITGEGISKNRTAKDGTASRSLTPDGVVVADCMDGEALSRAWLLAQPLQWNMPLTFGQLLHVWDVGSSVETLRFIVVSLIAASLSSVHLVRTLLRLQYRVRKARVLVAKSSDFQFPSADAMHSSLCPQMAMLLGVAEGEVSHLSGALLSLLAVPFTPEAHATVLEAEVQRFCVRLSRETEEQSSRFLGGDGHGCVMSEEGADGEEHNNICAQGPPVDVCDPTSESESLWSQFTTL